MCVTSEWALSDFRQITFPVLPSNAVRMNLVFLSRQKSSTITTPSAPQP